MSLMRWRNQGLEPWSSARDIDEVQSEMNRLFDSFFGRPAQSGMSERVWAPVADMYETKDELVEKTKQAAVDGVHRLVAEAVRTAADVVALGPNSTKK